MAYKLGCNRNLIWGYLTSPRHAGSGIAAARIGRQHGTVAGGKPTFGGGPHLIALNVRCAGRSKKPPGAFIVTDVADDSNELSAALNLKRPVDVIGAELGPWPVRYWRSVILCGWAA
jgi:hypothetical protein